MVPFYRQILAITCRLSRACRLPGPLRISLVCRGSLWSHLIYGAPERSEASGTAERVPRERHAQGRRLSSDESPESWNDDADGPSHQNLQVDPSQEGSQLMRNLGSLRWVLEQGALWG